MKYVAQYAKAIAAAVGAGLTVAITIYPHAAWIPIAVAALTPVGVAVVTNQPKPNSPKDQERTPQ